MSPWLDPNSYEPEPGFDSWWERNRVRVVVFAAIAFIALCAVVVPDATRADRNTILIETP